MASKSGKLKSKGLGTDPSLGKMGQRMISAMLREERIAERDLQEKLKAITEKEHKAMVKLGCDSLDIRHDLTLQRSSSPLSWEHKNSLTTGEFEDVKKAKEGQSDLDDSLSRPRLGRRAVSMLTYPTKQENITQVTEFKRANSDDVKSHFKTNPKSPTILIEKHNDSLLQEKDDENSVCDLNSGEENFSAGAKSSLSSKVGPSSSPRLLRRRPVSDMSSASVQVPHEEDNAFVEQIPLGKGVYSDVQLRPTPPSTPPPQRRNQNSLTPNATKPRPSSARSSRSRTPVGQNSPLREMESLKMDLPRRSRSPSPSPSRLSPEPSKLSLGRRGSAPPKIDANVLPDTSPLRKALVSNDVTPGGLRPATPDALRARLSSTEEELKDRVSVFLKSLEKK